AQLRVGLTVVFASIALAALIFLMSGTVGLFSPKLELYAYFENAGGLRIGAPVRLEGVDIGNVTNIALVPRSAQPAPDVTTPANQLPSPGTPGQMPIDKPVKVKMTIGNRFIFDLHKDSIAGLDTAGVLGETFIDIDSTLATGSQAGNGDILRTQKTKTLEGAVSATQSTIENVNTLVLRADRILTAIENGQGSLGLLINDKQLYRQLNSTLAEVQGLVADISNGKGSLGQLITSNDMYDKLNATVDKLSKIADDLDSGKGTVGKLMQDPSLYNRANEAVGKLNTTLDSVNSGHGAIGKMLRDEEFARKLDNTMTRVSDMMERIEKGQGSIGKLMNDPALYDNANQSIVEMRNLLTAIRQNPKKYLTIHMKLF
ncbi:MAG: MCE family protein, partial [Acidobacteria bacterium]|nr:MCE family protein [Acidobacteriota bacterium]